MGKKQSIWNDEIKIKKREPLNGDLSVEVAIIGAGITGILTAHFLQKAGKKVAVLEANRIGGGQTGNTTAKITYQHGMCYHNLIQNVGREEALDYLTANRLSLSIQSQAGLLFRKNTSGAKLCSGAEGNTARSEFLLWNR